MSSKFFGSATLKIICENSKPYFDTIINQNNPLDNFISILNISGWANIANKINPINQILCVKNARPISTDSEYQPTQYVFLWIAL